MLEINENEALLKLSKEELDKKKIITEVIKLGVEIKKIKRENELISKHPMTLPSAYVPLLVALIAFGGVVIKWRYDVKSAETKEREKSSLVTGLEAALAKTEPAQSVPTVGIRFRGSMKRELITSIQQSLNSDGFIAAPPIRTDVIESTSITYYAQSDKDYAEKVAVKTIEIFRNSGCSILPTPKLAPRTISSSKAIDLDIYTACK